MVLLRPRSSEVKSQSIVTNGRQLRAVASRLSCRESKSIQLLPHPRATELTAKGHTPLKIAKVAFEDESVVPSSPSLSRVLHTGALNRVVGREKEVTFLRQMLTNCIKNKNNASIYVSGAPGTGKTATVSQEVEGLTSKKMCHLLFINCMQLTSPRAVYKSISEQLSALISSSSSIDKVVAELEVVLEKKSARLPLIIVLDEIDQLASRCQDVLYTIFGWPDQLQNSRLIVIGIANALDLTERLLPGLQARAIRPTHLAFRPYSQDQIESIISERLLQQGPSFGEKVETIDKLALQFCAKKVAACSGDIRVALAICRRAIELARVESRNAVTNLTTGEKENAPNRLSLQHRLLASPALKANRDNYVVPTIRHISQAIREAQAGGDFFIHQKSPFKAPYQPVEPASLTLDVSTQRSSMPLHHKLVLATALLIRRLRGLREASLGQFFDAYSYVCGQRQLSALDQTEFLSVCELLDSHGVLRLATGGAKSALATPSRMRRVSLLLDDKGVERSLDDNLLLSSVLSIRSLP